MHMIRKPILQFLVLCCLVQLSPVSMRAYRLVNNNWFSTPYPFGAQIISNPTHVDLDGDTQVEDLIFIANRTIISSNGISLWESPSTWQVKQTLVGDLNQDGRLEVILLVRRPFYPWPVDRWLPYGGRISEFQDSSGQGSHIILVGWQDSRYKEVWAGSSMSEPAIAMQVADLNQDGRLELLTLEGSYNDSNSFPAHTIKLWEWNGFGFSLLSTLSGNFNDFEIIRSGSEHDNYFILVN